MRTIMFGIEAMICIEGVHGVWDHFDSREGETL